MIGQPPGARLKPLVKLGESASDCWEWIGSVSKTTGYGKKQFMGKTVSAHRWVWEMFFGRIPKGKVINHLCRNRKCVNPTHLEVTTSAGNCRHGIGTKLTEPDVIDIKKHFATRKRGETKRVLAQKYGVTTMTISDIWHGNSWAEVSHD